MKHYEELPSHLDYSLPSLQNAVGLCHRPRSASAAPSPSPERGEEPQHEDGPSPAAMKAVVQCCPRSTEIPSCSFHMISLRPLLKSHAWLRISARKAASGWLGCSPSPFSPRSIPQQRVPYGSSAQSRQRISSPSLCAHPCNFIMQAVCLTTGQGK